MASTLLLVLLFTVPSVAVVGSDYECAEGDSDCAGADADMNVMLQSKVIISPPAPDQRSILTSKQNEATVQSHDQDLPAHLGTSKGMANVADVKLSSATGKQYESSKSEGKQADSDPSQGKPSNAEPAPEAYPTAVEGTYKTLVANVSGLTHGSYRGWVSFHLASWSIYVVLAMLMWLTCYPSGPMEAVPYDDIERPNTTLGGGHLQCCRAPGICLWACLCPALRWADTVSSMSWLQMTSAMVAFFFCTLLNGLACGIVMWGPFTLILGLYYRHRLREEVGIVAWSFGSCCTDFVFLIFCPWCAIAQEARVATQFLLKASRS